MLLLLLDLNSAKDCSSFIYSRGATQFLLSDSKERSHSGWPGRATRTYPHCLLSSVTALKMWPTRTWVTGEVRDYHMQQAELHTHSEWVQTWVVRPQEQALWCNSANIGSTWTTCEERSIHPWLGLATCNSRQSCLPKSRWLGMGAQRWCMGNCLDQSSIGYSDMPWTGKVWMQWNLREEKVQLHEERISMYWTVHLQVSSLVRLNPYSIEGN